MPNRLSAESSPYLLQHAGNPVDWYPWGPEAFDRARRDDKPIFLSVGYSTCHWCHVMEHESFENAEVAAVLNERFVAIKVDREERPDVDRVYMAFVQATTGAGGWPMSVWLTPDLRPFYGGTYFPPSSRWGRPGFVDVLHEIARLWRDERPKVNETADGLTEHLRRAVTASPTELAARGVANADQLRSGADHLRASFDRRFGGFGPAPKFPRPSELLFLLRHHARTGETDLVEMVGATLRAMAFGGMHDHLGGGFHRYSVDREWRVPHFEKMLYDQAQLVLAFLELSQATGAPSWSSIAHDTLEYVARDLSHEGGGFYSAEDADSVPPEQASDPGAHRSEGAFYIWSTEEVDRLMGRDAQLVALRFGLEPSGNAPHDPHGEFGSKNLLYIARSMEDVASATQHTTDQVAEVLGRARSVLFAARQARPRPHLDDKVLTGWNGLMIAAFARAARVLDDPADDSSRRVSASCLDRARQAAAFIRTHLWDDQALLLHRRYRAGVAGIDGYAEDYACLIWGLLELFQADGDAGWLQWAAVLQRRQDELFWDPDGGGWFNTTGRDPSVLIRMKDDHDGAEPSAASVSASNLLTLVHLLGDRDGWTARLDEALRRIGPEAGQLARMQPMMLAVLEAWHHGLGQVVIVGRRNADETRRLHREVTRRYLPFHLVVPVDPGETDRAAGVLMPWLQAMTMLGGRATAYVCRNFACERPVTEPAELGRLLEPQQGS